MNNTLTDFISEIDSFSDQCFSHLPWCESAGIAILNQSTSPALSGDLPLFSVKRLAEIFSINSTWSQCHWFSLLQLACSTHTLTLLCLHTNVCAKHLSIIPPTNSLGAQIHSCFNCLFGVYYSLVNETQMHTASWSQVWHAVALGL